MGPTAGTLVGAMILIAYGWRAVFFALGALSLLWLVPWLARRDPSLEAKAAAQHEPASYREILHQRSLWGACLAQFCYSYPFYLVLTWLPLYLVNSQHLSLGSMAGVTAALYALQATAAVLSGWGSDIMIRNGHSPTVVRKGFVIAGMTATAAYSPEPRRPAAPQRRSCLSPAVHRWPVGNDGVHDRTNAGGAARRRTLDGISEHGGQFLWDCRTDRHRHRGRLERLLRGRLRGGCGAFGGRSPVLVGNRAENPAHRLEFPITGGAAGAPGARLIGPRAVVSEAFAFDPLSPLKRNQLNAP